MTFGSLLWMSPSPASAFEAEIWPFAAVLGFTIGLPVVFGWLVPVVVEAMQPASREKPLTVAKPQGSDVGVADPGAYASVSTSPSSRRS